ncbi:hypothetical protein ACV3UL_07935 [Clostridium perfringens]
MSREKLLLKEILGTGAAEVDIVMDLVDKYPDLIEKAKELALERCQLLSFGCIIEALVNNIKDSIDYDMISDDIEIIYELREFINSITIDDNGAAWGHVICSDGSSRFSDISDVFQELVNESIGYDEFYSKCNAILEEVLNS